MTRKDFVLIAAILKSERPSGRIQSDGDRAVVNTWILTVRAFGDKLKATNPRFDESRFLVACGLVQLESGCWECGGISRTDMNPKLVEFSIKS